MIFEVKADYLEQIAFQDGEYCFVEHILDIRMREAMAPFFVK